MTNQTTATATRGLRALFSSVTAIVLSALAATAMAALEAPMSHSANVQTIGQLPRVALPAVDPQARLKEDAAQTKPGPLRYAIPVDMSVTPDNAGTWEKLADGGRIWRYRVHAPGATDLNFGFTRYHLPRGATLYVISEKQDYYHGPYTDADNRDHGQHWTPMVPGDSAVIELYLPAKFESNTKLAEQSNSKPQARGPVNTDWLDLELGRVGTGYRDLFGTPNLTRQGACNIDTICPEGDNWRDEIRSAGQYSLGGSFFCSGTMIMDTSGTFTPFFLTANHCGMTAANAPSMVVLWNFEASVCGALSGGVASDTQSGATWLAARADADFTLLALNAQPDPSFNVHYAGWDATGAAPQSSMGISHPSNDEKALAINDDPLTTVNSCIGPTGVGNTHWFVDNYELGMTEPGSSGSGIWNPYGPDPLSPTNPKLVGVLSGGSAACAGSVPNAGNDCYGKFSEAWDGGATPQTRLRDWLDPNNSGILLVDGADPGGGEICGNAMIEGGETCDDGNATSGDGCSEICRVEDGFECTLPTPGGTINGVPDGGFELGTPNPVWTEASLSFGTPLCDVPGCGTGTGTGPNSGAWWVWFGGIAAFETGSVEQTFVICPEDTVLTFEVEQVVCDSPADFARVLIDGNEVFYTDGADPACGTLGYRTISIDLVNAFGGPYNDGQPHLLRAESEIFAFNLAGSNFFFDDFRIDRSSEPPQPSVCTPLPDVCAVLGTFDTPAARTGDLTGWTLFNTGPLTWDWGLTDDGICGSVNWTAGNYTGGSGEAACIDSDAAGTGVVNSYLCSPPIDLSTVAGSTLEFLYNFQVFSATGEDAFEVLVGTGPPNTVNVGSYTPVFLTVADKGDFEGAGASEALDISVFDGSTVHACFRYSGDFDWYAQVDDVLITADDCNVTVFDTDGDGVLDNTDNCTLVVNPNQIDADGDGIGNICDADLDQSCLVNFGDLSIMKAGFLGADPILDLDSSGAVNFADLSIMKAAFLQPPGPSATPCVPPGS